MKANLDSAKLAVVPLRRRGGDLHAPSQQVLLHGRRIAYRDFGGDGPVLLLVHGVGSSGGNWLCVVPQLVAGGARVVTVDLPGHGASSKDRGDYSLGAMACALRDLLDYLKVGQVVLVGHSLGGGIAMQFIYQFPNRASGLVLVSSGGLGEETLPLLRAATLPGASWVLSVISHRKSLASTSWVRRTLSRVRLNARIPSDDSLGKFAELSDRGTRNAFLSTLRSVVDISGQRVSALDALPAAAHLPILLIWGDRDPTIPLRHGQDAHALLPNSRLVVFEGAGHEPQSYDPDRFAAELIQYLDRMPGPTK